MKKEIIALANILNKIGHTKESSMLVSLAQSQELTPEQYANIMSFIGEVAPQGGSQTPLDGSIPQPMTEAASEWQKVINAVETNRGAQIWGDVNAKLKTSEAAIQEAKKTVEQSKQSLTPEEKQQLKSAAKLISKNEIIIYSEDEYESLIKEADFFGSTLGKLTSFFGKSIPIVGDIAALTLTAKNFYEACINARDIFTKLPLQKYGITVPMIISYQKDALTKQAKTVISSLREIPTQKYDQGSGNLEEFATILNIIAFFWTDVLKTITNGLFLLENAVILIGAILTGPFAPITAGVGKLVQSLVGAGFIIGLEWYQEGAIEEVFSELRGTIKGIAQAHIEGTAAQVA